MSNRSDSDSRKGHEFIDERCWAARDCIYDDYEPEPNIPYCGDVFSRLADFESPPNLIRRFHINFCKALFISRINEYSLIESHNHLDYQIKRVTDNFDLQTLCRHNELILIIGACETFFKDAFIQILNINVPEKKGRKTAEEISRKFSFQNIASITKAFSFVCKDFNEYDIYNRQSPYDFDNEFDLKPHIDKMLKRRHAIVHDSHYFTDLDEKRIVWYEYLCYSWVDQFDMFLDNNNYYEQIDKKMHTINFP